MSNALIHIKGRRDPITVSSDRAKEIKKIRFGTPGPNGEVFGKADAHDDLDLGEWCGEIGQIKSIEFEKEVKKLDNDDKQAVEDAKKRESWIRQSPEVKARHFEYFRICWSSRHDFKRVEPSQSVLDKVYQIQLEYFRVNPLATATPIAMFESILPRKAKYGSLSEKIKVNVNIDDIPA